MTYGGLTWKAFFYPVFSEKVWAQPGANRTAHPSLKRQTRSPWLIPKIWMWPSEPLILSTHLPWPKARQPGGLGAKSGTASATLHFFGLQYASFIFCSCWDQAGVLWYDNYTKTTTSTWNPVFVASLKHRTNKKSWPGDEKNWATL